MEHKDFAARYHIVFLAVIFDFISIIFSAYLSHSLIHHQFILPPESKVFSMGVALVVIINLTLLGVYHSWRGRKFDQLVARVCCAWLIAFFLVSGALVFLRLSVNLASMWVLYWAVLSVSITLFSRYSVVFLLSWLRLNGRNIKHIFIIGKKSSAEDVIETLKMKPQYGFNVANYINLDEIIDTTLETDYFESVVSQSGCNEVWVCLPLSNSQEVQRILYCLRNTTLDIRYIPDWSGFQLINHCVTKVADFYMFDLNCSPMNNGATLLKELEDKILSFLILVLISPILVLIAFGVKFSSPGPIFYRQERVGWNGRPFVMYKFRTMRVEAESESGPIWATQGDNRPTPFGRFLRKTSLDELPQFYNVLKGDMSIVGPRPERKVFVDQFKEQVPGYMKKHLVKAGVTGWAQVNGWRGNTSLKKRIEHDLYYVENWSVLFDLKIIGLTLVKGFVDVNAY